MNGFGWVIFGEGLHLTTMTTGPLFGVEPHRAMTWRGEFSVRLKIEIFNYRVTFKRLNVCKTLVILHFRFLN